MKQESCSAFLWVADAGKIIALVSPTNKYNSCDTVLQKAVDELLSRVKHENYYRLLFLIMNWTQDNSFYYDISKPFSDVLYLFTFYALGNPSEVPPQFYK